MSENTVVAVNKRMYYYITTITYSIIIITQLIQIIHTFIFYFSIQSKEKKYHITKKRAMGLLLLLRKFYKFFNWPKNDVSLLFDARLGYNMM